MTQLNKSAIYERDELAKDKIMQGHLDLRLRNTAAFRINENLGSMRNQAKRLAKEYN